MHDKRLRIYLDDHLALIAAEVELIARCRGRNRGTPLGDFLQRLESEVRSQKSLAEDLNLQIGGKWNLEGQLKQSAAWFLEKVGRLKLNDSLLSYSPLSRVVELEMLSIAAQERSFLWDNLDAVLSGDDRWSGISCSYFRDQSLQHFEELKTRRRFAAVEAFSSPPESG